MFEWLFPPRCPCDEPTKAWIERRLQWLSEEFDDHAFNGRRIVLPTEQFFPDRYDESYDAVRSMLDRVCGYMDIDSEQIELTVKDDFGKLWMVNDAGSYVPQAVGTYQDYGYKSLITIDKSMFHRPLELVGTFAHELAHVRLLGEGRARSEEFDNEMLTDLTAVFFGLGIFLANGGGNTIQRDHCWPGTRVNRPEYMTLPMFSYALAHLAWFRGEEKPDWARHLHSNVRPEFKQATRFLFQTGDSDFAPKKARRKIEPPARQQRSKRDQPNSDRW